MSDNTPTLLGVEPLTRHQIDALALPGIRTAQKEWSDQRVAFLDFETTGLDPWLGYRAWECAIIVREPDGTWVEKTFIIPLDPDTPKDPKSLDIAGFNERYKIGNLAPKDIAPKRKKVLQEIREMLSGAIVYAANAKFDYAHIRFLMVESDLPLETWFRFECITTLAAMFMPGGGMLRQTNLEWTATAFGVIPSKDGKHEAMPDTRVVRDIFLILEHMQITERTRLKREREGGSRSRRQTPPTAQQSVSDGEPSIAVDPPAADAGSTVPSPFDLAPQDMKASSAPNWLAEEAARAKAAWDANYAEQVRAGETTIDEAIEALRPWVVEQLRGRGETDVRAQAKANAVLRELRKAVD